MKQNFTSAVGLFLLIQIMSAHAQSSAKWVTYEGQSGEGKGKHIVFVSGDEEYRSEEALPMLAKILSQHHGFKCTVLFALDPVTGRIDPNNQTNIPGLEQLKTADLMVMSLRFRELPDDQMKYIHEYLEAGKPIVALRTSTHAFRYTRNLNSPYARYGTGSKVKGWENGFGKAILGETWVSHHGEHGSEGDRGLINGILGNHPVLKGVQDLWGYTDVYTINNLPANAQVLVYGQSTKGMTPQALPNYGKSVMPVVWIRDYTQENGKTSRIFTTTYGASVDFVNEDLRRLVINACYWAMKMESSIPAKADASLVGSFQPTMFGFDKFIRGLQPSDFEIK